MITEETVTTDTNPRKMLGQPSAYGDSGKTIAVRIPVPAREETISVSASRQGATIQLGIAAFKLRRSEALAIADALVDCCEFYGLSESSDARPNSVGADEEKETQNG